MRLGALPVSFSPWVLPMPWMPPAKALLATTILAIVSLLGLFVPHQTVAIASFCLVGLGFVNIFPLVFSITIDRMPQPTNALSGLMVSAVIGGAVLPPIMGYIAARSSVWVSFLVPLAAIGYTL
jgi:fucose permease